MPKKLKLRHQSPHKSRNAFLFLLFLIGLAVFFHAPLVTVPAPTQYQVGDAGKIESTPIASPSAQTPQQALSATLAPKPKTPQFDDKFARWSILVNQEAGYRLAYPAGFNANYDFGKVTITPPSGQGQVTVYIRDGSFEVKTFTEGLEKNDADLITAAANLVRQTFQLIPATGYDSSAAQERFNQ